MNCIVVQYFAKMYARVKDLVVNRIQ